MGSLLSVLGLKYSLNVAPFEYQRNRNFY